MPWTRGRCIATLASLAALGISCGGSFEPALRNSVEAALAASPAWVFWAGTQNGMAPGTYPVLAIAPLPRRDIYYSNISGAVSGTGVVWRARLDDPSRAFSVMPAFPLPTPATGMPYQNVFTMTTNLNGEPIVGLFANGRSNNIDPMIMTWDESAGRWIAPPISPASGVCGHNLYRVSRAPNGDIWGICQWHGAYHSIDAGRSFQYVDVSALLGVTHPAYYPTRASGATNLGALYSLAFGTDGTIFIGTETGGVVYSPDRGATWHPVDYDSTNPSSTMARVTNSGNVYGLGVTASGGLVMQATPGSTGTPPADPTHLYQVDLVAHSVTIARGIPDYFMGGRVQIVTLPSGAIFFHSNHDTVNASTGASQPGGIFTSVNGIDWSAMNTGINEVFAVSPTSWVDANGRGDEGGFALDGTDLFTATTNGKIFQLSAAGGSPADAGTGGPDAGGAGAPGTSPGGAVVHGGGCVTVHHASGGERTWSLVLVAVLALSRRRRRPRTERGACG
jgi:hypothetical protein